MNPGEDEPETRVTVAPIVPLTRNLGSGLHTWGPERITRLGRGDGCESMTRFYLGVDSWFPKETQWIQWLAATKRPFGGCHSIHLSYGRTPLILQEYPHDGVIVWVPGVGREMGLARPYIPEISVTIVPGSLPRHLIRGLFRPHAWCLQCDTRSALRL
jgi:hypothetical protein